MLSPIQAYFDEINSLLNVVAHLSDARGKIVASTDKQSIGTSLPIDIIISLDCEEQHINLKHIIHELIFDSDKFFIVCILSNPSQNDLFKLIIHSVEHICSQSKPSEIAFNLYSRFLNGNLEAGEFENKLKDISFDTEFDQCLVLVETDRDSDFISISSSIRALFEDDNKLMINKLENNLIAIVFDRYDEMDSIEFGESVLSVLENDVMIKARVAIGPKVNESVKIFESLKGAISTINIGSEYDNSIRLLVYDRMSMAKLIGNIGEQAAKDFVMAILPKDVSEQLDDVHLNTMISFFENSLNISETSRKMFIHRNTLVYRLEKINKITGLDICIFEQAVQLYLAIILKKYLESFEKKEDNKGAI